MVSAVARDFSRFVVELGFGGWLELNEHWGIPAVEGPVGSVPADGDGAFLARTASFTTTLNGTAMPSSLSCSSSFVKRLSE